MDFALSTVVGLSALLISTYRVMRRPIDLGTSDRTGSTFFVYVCKQQHFYLLTAKRELLAKMIYI